MPAPSSATPPPDSETTLRATVRGRVQGVGYRYFVIHRADSLGLRGMVRNLPDGAVEVEAIGDRPVIERLIEHLRQGPSFAKVTGVQLEWGVGVAERDRFEVGF